MKETVRERYSIRMNMLFPLPEHGREMIILKAYTKQKLLSWGVPLCSLHKIESPWTTLKFVKPSALLLAPWNEFAWIFWVSFWRLSSSVDVKGSNFGDKRTKQDGLVSFLHPEVSLALAWSQWFKNVLLLASTGSKAVRREWLIWDFTFSPSTALHGG